MRHKQNDSLGTKLNYQKTPWLNYFTQGSVELKHCVFGRHKSQTLKKSLGSKGIKIYNLRLIFFVFIFGLMQFLITVHQFRVNRYRKTYQKWKSHLVKKN